MFTAYTIARRHGYKGTMHSYTMAEFGRALLKNIWSLMAPVVILGGIYAGICTPVEASVVAVWYALFVGFFITKKLSLKEVFNAMKLANISTGTILIVVGVSTIFGRFLTMYQIPQQLAAQMMLYTTNPILILLLIAALLFFLGMFMETLATIVVLAPVFLPIIKSVGIDPVFFGVFWVITNEIALLTPPLGVNLFIAMNLSNLPLERVAKGACPYIFLLILVVFFLSLLPRRRDVPPEGARHVLMVRRPAPCPGGFPAPRTPAEALPLHSAREQRSLDPRRKRFLPRQRRGRKRSGHKGISLSPEFRKRRAQKNLLSTNLGGFLLPHSPKRRLFPQWIAAAPFPIQKAASLGNAPYWRQC